MASLIPSCNDVPIRLRGFESLYEYKYFDINSHSNTSSKSFDLYFVRLTGTPKKKKQIVLTKEFYLQKYKIKKSKQKRIDLILMLLLLFLFYYCLFGRT